jgi:hypothetical protein
MAIILPHGLTSQEIRVLQEFRRLTAESLSADAIKAIKHPAGGGEKPAVDLVAKGFLEADGSLANFALTPKAKDLLAIDPVPLVEETGDSGAGGHEHEDAEV